MLAKTPAARPDEWFVVRTEGLADLDVEHFEMWAGLDTLWQLAAAVSAGHSPSRVAKAMDLWCEDWEDAIGEYEEEYAYREEVLRAEYARTGLDCP
jgi:hypothetical protein